MRDKIAFVVPRYGLEVNGGAELYCRQLAGKMKKTYDVEIFTTCAVDNVTWKNEYRAGTGMVDGITVQRFPTTRTRDITAFNHFSEYVLQIRDHSDKDEGKWILDQGPVCPELLKTLWARRSEFRSVIFIGYLYYPEVKGLLMGFENPLFIPTAHDEAAIYLRCYEKTFAAAKGLIYLTREERDFAEKRFPFLKDKPAVVTGAGVELPNGKAPPLPEELRGADYVVYAGRIDKGKGCGELFDFFRRYKKERGGELKLALMGKPVMEVPQAEDIVDLGFVSEEMKFAVMAQAKALVLFSQFESLSMVVLESMAVGRPVLVNGKCLVLKGHCVRSNAGLWFENYPEFAATLDWLLTHPAEYAVMGENGKRYVAENYQWDKIVARIQGLIEGKPTSGTAGAEKSA